MRVAELSRRTGVSVASIKYYLREGLLPAGERTGPNQADYGDAHVHRLRLVRALLDVGGISVAAAKEVLGVVDDEQMTLHDALGVAQDAVMRRSEPLEDEAGVRAEKVLDDLAARRGWHVSPENPGRRAVVDVLATLERLDHGEVGGLLESYAAAVEGFADEEVGAVVVEEDRGRSVEGVVTGIVLGGALLLGLRGMAQENASRQRLV
jgi:DNA-binding transcriptional MerR regulator